MARITTHPANLASVYSSSWNILRTPQRLRHVGYVGGGNNLETLDQNRPLGVCPLPSKRIAFHEHVQEFLLIVVSGGDLNNKDFHSSGPLPICGKLFAAEIGLALASTHRVAVRERGAGSSLLRLFPPVRETSRPECRAAGCTLFP